MIRQIVVEQEDGKPDLVGLLLTSRDLSESESAKLGERLARLENVRPYDSLRGQYKGIRWKWVPTDRVTSGLEFQTITVPRGTVAGAPRAVTYGHIRDLELLAAADKALAPATFRDWQRKMVAEIDPLAPFRAVENEWKDIPFAENPEMRAWRERHQGAMQASRSLMNLVADEPPCDSLPAWLWVVAALVVIGVLIAVASPAFIAGVL
jgi:hypothetical protein